ncbi:MAG: ABC transporter ATP-binding protein [Acidimicrobiales bacterium]
MSPRGTVAAHHLWKRFRPDRGRSLLRDEIERLRTHGPRKAWTWALRDVDFEIEPGGSFAFIGSNGSGKSTLLKILTQVMYPYAGSIEAVGRVGALIEVASGIHPDLTGRENCYLYGSLLGLPRQRVAAQFDEIVAFAELDDAIDRQVKYYSSGMKMRLGFAVAAFLEPDVLLVDEVLAVGDATFQQRCLDRMRQVLANGTTLVYVSHDLATVEAMCSSALWLKKGVVEEIGATADVMAGYRRWIEEGAEGDTTVDGEVRILKAAVSGVDGDTVATGGPVRIEVRLHAPEPRSGTLQLGISQGPASPLLLLKRDVELAGAELEVRCTLASLPFAAGRYYLWLGVFGEHGRDLMPWHPTGHFDIAGPPLDEAPVGIVRLAPIHLDAEWSATEV